MQLHQRHQYIAKALQSEASVATIELARALRVSQETIRRDLIQLEVAGLLRRVYGGAVTLSRQRSSEPPFAQRTVTNAEAKRTVGGLAAHLVESEQTIFLDVGTTAQAAAQALAPHFRGTIVSHSLLVALAIAQGAEADLILAPGHLRRGEWSLSGAATHKFIAGMRFDVALLSCGGIDAKAGPTDFTFDDVEIKQTVAQNSETVHILADSSKHGLVGHHTIGDWYDVNGLVTDTPPPQGITSRIRTAGGTIHLPSTSGTSS